MSASHSPKSPNSKRKTHFSTARIFRLAVLIIGFAIICFVLFFKAMPV